MNQTDQLDRYYLTTAQRHALWQNELGMFIVLAMPLVVATFWYGATIEVVDILGRVLVPPSFSRGVGLALCLTFVLTAGGMIYLYVQPAADRVRNAQPVRGRRRLAFAAFVGLLVGLNTFQTLVDVKSQDAIMSGALAVGLAALAALIAFVAMLSMDDIPAEPAPASTESDRVRGTN